MNYPLVSIILPCYNMQHFLKQSINSILNQTFNNWEAIFIDDGSTDKTREIISSFANEDPRIKYYYQKNQGQGSARNFGLKKSKGKYIFFLDPDDWILSETIEKVLERMISTGADFTINSYFEIDESRGIKRQKSIVNKNLINKAEINRVLKQLDSERMIFIPWNKMYKKEFLEKYNISFATTRKNEDVKFACECFINANHISTSSTPYYCYRNGRLGSTQSKITDKDYSTFLSNVEIKLRMFESYGYNITKKKNDLIIEYAFSDSIRVYRLLEKTKSYKTFHKKIKKRKSISMANQISFFSCMTLNVRLKKILISILPLNYLLLKKKIY